MRTLRTASLGSNFTGSYIKKEFKDVYLVNLFPVADYGNMSLQVSKCGAFTGPLVPVFRLDTKIYLVNLRIHFEYTKMRTRKTTCLEYEN